MPLSLYSGHMDKKDRFQKLAFDNLEISRRSVLLGLGALAGAAAAPRLAAAGTNAQPAPQGPIVNAAAVLSNTPVGSIGTDFAGLSYEKGSMASEPLFTPNSANLIGMFQRLGRSLLRIGGNSVDRTLWTANGAGQTSGQVAPPDVDNLAGFLQATGWKVLYGVNMGTSNPQLAADEVSYAVQALGESLYGIEIGNECDLYGSSYFANQGWNLQSFLTLWGEFRNAILQISPNAILTGPASASNITTWTIPFGEAVGHQIILLTQHYYRGNGESSSSTVDKLISPDPTLVQDLSELKAGAQAIGLPFRLSETNSFYNGGATGVSDSCASALWVIDHLFRTGLGGGVGVNMHGGGNSGGYTPIADNRGSVVEARPEYYGLLFFTLAGSGVLLPVTVWAGGVDVTAYAIQTSTHGLSLVVVNKDTTNNLSLSIECQQPVQGATLELLTCPSLSATSGVTIQGATVGVDGSFSPGDPYALDFSGTRIAAYVNAMSAALIRVAV